MKLKYILISFLFILLTVSVVQLFSLPPYAGEIFDIYKSGYFSELDREFEIIRDSFLEIKSSGEPVYGWIFLEKLKKEQRILIDVYNRKGQKVAKPGMTTGGIDNEVAGVMSAFSPSLYSRVRGGEYYSILPVSAEKRCIICHKGIQEGGLLGALSFRRPYNALIYYNSERVLVFLLISLLLMGALYLLIRWDPEKKIKEMFDNS